MSAPVTWQEAPATAFDSPLVWNGPYVECKLEHSELEPTCLGDQFFPDSVPYRSGENDRVFYWRNRLPTVVPPREGWTGVCATTHDLAPLVHDSRHEPTLLQSFDDEFEIVVDGTIVGDSKTALVSTYSPPQIDIQHVTSDGLELEIEGEKKLIPAGSRQRFSLSEQTVETEHGTAVPTTPELVVRFPGERAIYHPAPSDNYCLFPSFGLDIDDIPRRVHVPTNMGELDHDALAAEFGIDVTERPYPERILWQAFAFTAFDPNANSEPTLTQFESGEFAVRE
ncbi:hypothetical protein [Halovenus halobia]|uniref:hypothetical protein n=1 Tax=Halovenus halobia TaxID=3396622 RepID=UPI003F56B3B6